MTQVLDYSAGFPGALAIVRAGFVGAVRYIGFPKRSKCTSAAELDDFSRNGLGMALVFEDTDTSWRGGWTAGKAGAQLAHSHADQIGFPKGRPIYMAVDQDAVTEPNFAVMLDYLLGAGSVLGGPQGTGVYGEADVIDRARTGGVASWYWQTAAWSHGRHTSAHLYQRIGSVSVGGIDCDVNDVLALDWGQHNAEVEDMTPEQDAALGAVWAYTARKVPKDLQASRSLQDDLGFLVSEVRAVGARVDAVTGALSTMEADVVAAIRAEPTGQVDTDKLAADLRQGLGEEIADDLGRRLLGHTTTEGTP